VIIDTTYLLPLAKISVPVDLFDDILKGKISIGISSLSVNLISIFELQAKAAKLNIPHQHVLRAVSFIMRYLRVINFWDEEIIRISFELRKFLPDYIDCVILATSIQYNETLLTEDSRIHETKKYIKETYGAEVISYSELLEKT